MFRVFPQGHFAFFFFEFPPRIVATHSFVTVWIIELDSAQSPAQNQPEESLNEPPQKSGPKSRHIPPTTISEDKKSKDTTSHEDSAAAQQRSKLRRQRQGRIYTVDHCYNSTVALLFTILSH